MDVDYRLARTLWRIERARLEHVARVSVIAPSVTTSELAHTARAAWCHHGTGPPSAAKIPVGASSGSMAS
jgi:hypothetical protein